MSELKARLLDDIKTAMKSGAKERLATLRLMSSAVKQIEIDTRAVLDDVAVLGIFEKMLKMRKDSIEQFTAANRHDLADIEKSEVVIIQHYLPEPLSAAELESAIDASIADVGATSAKDMGKVIAALKVKVAGRADMTALSAKVKAKLA
jgi:uncharacterized protein